MASRPIIYRITNTVNGQVYIGLTKRGAAVRWCEHKHNALYGRRGNRLCKAMHELGVDKFEFTVICRVDDESELPALERHFIEKYDSFRNGYNSTDGGESVSSEVRAKISKAHKGRKAPWAVNNWDRRRANGTDRIDMSKFVPSGALSTQAKRFRIRDKNGDEQIVVGLNAFCKANGLTAKCLYDTMNGLQTHHKGYAMLGYADNAAVV